MEKINQLLNQNEKISFEGDWKKKMKRDKYEFLMNLENQETEESDFKAFCENEYEWSKKHKIEDSQMIKACEFNRERNLMFLMFLFERNKDLFFILKNHENLMEMINLWI